MARRKKDLVLLRSNLYVEDKLPHRGNFRLISKVVLPGGNGHSPLIFYNVPKKPFWAKDHFPGDPIMPGVILLEIANQSAAIFEILTNKEIKKVGLPILTNIIEANFKRPVKPGDKLTIKIEKIEEKEEKLGIKFYFKVKIYKILNEKNIKEILEVFLVGTVR